MNHVTICTTLLAALLIASCGTPAPVTIDRSLADASRARWNSHGLTDYEFVIENRCFCTIDGSYRITVKNNRVVDVFNLTLGLHVPEHFYRENGMFRTIGELFAQIDLISGANPDQFQAAFDPTYGYPNELFVDGSSSTSDDEFGYHIRALETRSIW